MSVGHSLPKQITELFEWDPTEPMATRPMFMQYRVPGQTCALFYTHDGNKNVSEVVHFSRANGVAAHYGDLGTDPWESMNILQVVSKMRSKTKFSWGLSPRSRSELTNAVKNATLNE